MFASVIFELETGAAVAHACFADVGPALGALPSAAQPCVACGISHVDSVTISPMLAALTLFESGAARGTADSDAAQLVPSSPRVRAAMHSSVCRRLAGDKLLFSDRAGSAILMRPLLDATGAGAPIAGAGAIRASAAAPGLSSAQLMVACFFSANVDECMMLYTAGQLCAHVVMTVVLPAAASGLHTSGCIDLITPHQLRNALDTRKGKRQARAALCDSQWTSISSLVREIGAAGLPSEHGGVLVALVCQGAAGDSHSTPPSAAKLRLLIVLLRSDVKHLLVAMQPSTIVASADGAAAIPVIADTPAAAAQLLATAVSARSADPSRVASVQEPPSDAPQPLSGSGGTGRFRAGRYKPAAMAFTGRVPAPPSEAPESAAPAVASSVSGPTLSAASAAHVRDGVAVDHAPAAADAVRRSSGAALPSKEEGAVRSPSAPSTGEGRGALAVEHPAAVFATCLTAPPAGQGVVVPRPPPGPPPSHAQVPSGDRRRGWLPNIFRARSGATQRGAQGGPPTERGLGVAVPPGSGGGGPFETVASSSRLNWLVQSFGRRGRSLGPVRQTAGDAPLPPVTGGALADAVSGFPPPRSTGAWPWRRSSASAAPVSGRVAAAPLHTRETAIDAIGTPAKESASLPRFVSGFDGRHGLPPLSFAGTADADADAAPCLRPTPPAGAPPLRHLPPAAPQSSVDVDTGVTRSAVGQRPGWFGRFSRGRTLVRATAASAGAIKLDAEAERLLDKPVPPTAVVAPAIHTMTAPAQPASALAAPEALFLCQRHSPQTGGMCGTCSRPSTARCGTFQSLSEAWETFSMAASGCSSQPTAADCADSAGAGGTAATITDSPRHLLSCLQKLATESLTLSLPATDIHGRDPSASVLLAASDLTDVAGGVAVLDTGSELLIALFDRAPELLQLPLSSSTAVDGSPTNPGSSHAAAIRHLAAATGHILRLRLARPPASIADTPTEA
jgi:hypothetical protein